MVKELGYPGHFIILSEIIDRIVEAQNPDARDIAYPASEQKMLDTDTATTAPDKHEII
ncbi:hypothetical protein HGT70_03925 [Rosenbergiella collisarenosi]|uniref:hypothetical protein n=1 Tax=Rosenbergiella collisarenosi TaxID=1544695 RepID=UPI001BD9B922|nr:hypothetical protein [Rosenbergiella collisarenosi]MBT0720429.1 hypothetical protein [Rosenbergiella collisarenosi]